MFEIAYRSPLSYQSVEGGASAFDSGVKPDIALTRPMLLCPAAQYRSRALKGHTAA